jgi:hypothetical protein
MSNRTIDYVSKEAKLNGEATIEEWLNVAQHVFDCAPRDLDNLIDVHLGDLRNDDGWFYHETPIYHLLPFLLGSRFTHLHALEANRVYARIQNAIEGHSTYRDTSIPTEWEKIRRDVHIIIDAEFDDLRPTATANITMLELGGDGKNVLTIASPWNGAMIVMEDPSSPWQPEIAGKPIALTKHKAIKFLTGPTELFPNETAEFSFVLTNYPFSVYSRVLPHETFTLRNGLEVVGHGKILSRVEPDPRNA